MAAVGMAWGVSVLPLGDPFDDAAAMYRAIYHGRPVANGYSGYGAPHYQILAHALETFDHDILVGLSRLGVRDLLVDRQTDVDGAYADYLSTHAGTRLVASDDREVLSRLPVAPPAPPRAQGTVVRVTGLEANVDAERTSFAVDGDRATRWTTGRQRPGDTGCQRPSTTKVRTTGGEPWSSNQLLPSSTRSTFTR